MNPKIMANVGLRSADYQLLKKMALAGMEVVRLNFAHASNAQLIELKKNLINIKKETGKDIKILQDLGGPRIRVGVLPNDVYMKEGELYSFLYGRGDLGKRRIPIDYDGLAKDVEVDHPFYLANGAIELIVEKIEKKEIFARVERGGVLSSKKGINLPKTNLSDGGLTKKDELDAIFGKKQKVDYIGLSFTQSAEDVRKL